MLFFAIYIVLAILLVLYLIILGLNCRLRNKIATSKGNFSKNIMENSCERPYVSGEKSKTDDLYCEYDEAMDNCVQNNQSTYKPLRLPQVKKNTNEAIYTNTSM